MVTQQSTRNLSLVDSGVKGKRDSGVSIWMYSNGRTSQRAGVLVLDEKLGFWKLPHIGQVHISGKWQSQLPLAPMSSCFLLVFPF